MLTPNLKTNKMKNNKNPETAEFKSSADDYQFEIDEMDLGEMESLSDSDLCENLWFADALKSDNIMDFFWNAELKTVPKPSYYNIHISYDDYDSFIQRINKPIEKDFEAMSIYWKNILVYISDNIFCYDYAVYDTSKKDDNSEYLMIGDSMYCNKAINIIYWYLKTGECLGHL